MKPGPLNEYFVDAYEVGYAYCKLCKTQLRSERLSNLKRHLRNLHQVNVDTANKNTQQKEETELRSERNLKVDKSLNHTLRSFLGLVTEDNVPFTVLNSQNLRTLLEPICKRVLKLKGKRIQLNSDTCSNALHIVATEVRNQIKTELKDKLVSIKVTSCSDLSVKTYVVSSTMYKEFAMHSVTLGLIRTTELGKNANDLTNEIIATVQKYDIDINKIVAVTLDNVSDISVSSLTTLFDNESENIQISPCLATVSHLSCVDVINNIDVKFFLNICRNLTRFVENSAVCRRSLEIDCLSVPQLDCETRRGSTYEMVWDIKAAKYYLSDSAEAVIDLPSGFWDFVDGFIEAMGPLQRSLSRYKQEIHYSDFYAQWLKCKLSTECIIKKNDNDKENFAYKIGTLILKSMQTRQISNKCLHSCLYLDPRFHRTLNGIQKTEARAFLKYLWDKLGHTKPLENIMEPDVKSVIKSETENQLLDTYLSHSINHEPPVDSVTAYSTIDCLKLPFMKSDTDVLKFWESKKNTDSELYQLSEICYSIPPTQTISTSVLETLKQINETYRDCSKDMWENLLLIRLHSSHLKQDVEKSFSLLENTIDIFCQPPAVPKENCTSADIIENSCDYSENDDVETETLHNSSNIRSDEIFEGECNALLKMEFYEGSDSIANCENSNDPLRGSQNPEKTSRRNVRRLNNTASKSATRKKEFLCVTCGNKFTQSHSLKTHMLRHLGEKKFQCQLCPKSFINSSALKCHVRTHAVEKSYVCDICNRGFNSRHRLRHHSRSHTGVKNYQCEFCNMRFRTRGNQKRHMLSHTGEKPYRCKYCDRSFAQSNDCNKHLKKHLGANIFQCDLCPLRFPLVRDLRVHFATHKDDDEETRAKNLAAREDEEKHLKIQFSSLE